MFSQGVQLMPPAGEGSPAAPQGSLRGTMRGHGAHGTAGSPSHAFVPRMGGSLRRLAARWIQLFDKARGTKARCTPVCPAGYEEGTRSCRPRPCGSGAARGSAPQHQTTGPGTATGSPSSSG